MDRKEAVEYWKTGIGQEMYYYDSKFEMDQLIGRCEKQLQAMIKLNKLTKDELKYVLDLPDHIFEHLYRRNV